MLLVRWTSVALKTFAWILTPRWRWTSLPNEYRALQARDLLSEALNPGLRREDQAKFVPAEERAAVLAPPTMPLIPPNAPPGMRAEMELVSSEMVNDYPETRSLSEPSGIPIVVVSAMPPNRLKSRGNRAFGIEPWDQAGLALTSPKGMFVVRVSLTSFLHFVRSPNTSCSSLSLWSPTPHRQAAAGLVSPESV
jgi:hypothetical protein